MSGKTEVRILACNKGGFFTVINSISYCTVSPISLPLWMFLPPSPGCALEQCLLWECPTLYSHRSHSQKQWGAAHSMKAADNIQQCWSAMCSLGWCSVTSLFLHCVQSTLTHIVTSMLVSCWNGSGIYSRGVSGRKMRHRNVFWVITGGLSPMPDTEGLET